jgi:hypothetical protein
LRKALCSLLNAIVCVANVGHFAWRNGQNGSWFVQAIFEQLNEFAFSLDLVKILTRVNHQVALDFESRNKDWRLNNKKQVPSIVSMLTKDLHFTKKK